MHIVYHRSGLGPDVVFPIAIDNVAVFQTNRQWAYFLSIKAGEWAFRHLFGTTITFDGDINSGILKVY